MNANEIKETIENRINEGKKILSRLEPSRQKIGIDNDIIEKIIYKSANDDFEIWDDFNSTLIIENFPNTTYAKEYKDAIYFDANLKTINQINHKIERLKNTLNEKIKFLIKLKNRIDIINYDAKSIENDSNNIRRIFISHSSEDKKIVEKFIQILELFGLSDKEIFCTSVEGYGVPLGKDFIERIREELNSNSIVISILTNNYYNSAISLCEMGAAWIKTKEFIPIIVPPLKFKEIDGIFPTSIIGMEINNKFKLNELKEKFENEYNLSKIKNSRWESKRDTIIKEMDNIIGLKKNSDHIIEKKNTIKLSGPGIKFSEREYFKVIDDRFLNNDMGIFNLWAYVRDEHNAIHSNNRNMYMIGYATNGGEPLNNPSYARYPNAWSISRIVPTKNNQIGIWRFWCNQTDKNKTYLDYSKPLSDGWHLFTISWSKDNDYIKFIIDCNVVAEEKFINWPTDFSGSIVLGSWANKHPIHYFSSNVGPWEYIKSGYDEDKIKKYFNKPPR